uniref:Protein kinase domain-containing protein n=1 Tax=Acanthochromis polyacanthus TaxID=80966 RepID=A0A3Q1G690_9TELE
MANPGISRGRTFGSCHIVEEILGEDDFGVVAKCCSTMTNKTVAIKFSKSEESVVDQVICISFELLDQSLHLYLRDKNTQCLSMEELRPILHQLTTALSHLHSINIIHVDLKPVNIMVVDCHQHPFKVKIIDFGLACSASEMQQGERRGTVSYRTPQMSLGSFDMWALGLTMAELVMGCKLYPGLTDYDVLRVIIETPGQPPDDILDHDVYTQDFFYAENCGRPRWRFKTPDDVYNEYGFRATETRSIKLCSLDDIEQKMEPHRNQKMLVSVIKSLLNLDPCRRITTQEVHQFFALSLPQSSSRDRNDAIHINYQERHLTPPGSHQLYIPIKPPPPVNMSAPVIGEGQKDGKGSPHRCPTSCGVTISGRDPHPISTGLCSLLQHANKDSGEEIESGGGQSRQQGSMPRPVRDPSGPRFPSAATG